MANYESVDTSYTSSDFTEPTDMTFEQMYAVYYDDLVIYMRNHFQNLPEADHAEIVQDSMIKAMMNFDEYSDIGQNRKAWLYRITKNTALDRIRMYNRRKTDPSSETFEFTQISDRGAEKQYGDIELSESYAEGLDHIARILTDKERENGLYATFYLYAIEELQYTEIANRLGIEEGTVKSRISRIKRRLMFDAAMREYLGKEPINQES